MKKIFLMLLVAATIVSCNKQEIKPSSQSEENPIFWNGQSSKSTSLGSTISESEANARIDRFKDVSPNWTLSFQLSESNYDSLIGVSNSVAIGVFYAIDGNDIPTQIYIPLDTAGRLLTSVVLQGDNSGGSSITLSNAEDYITAAKVYDTTTNTTNHPTLLAIGKTASDYLLSQDGAEGLNIYNAQIEDSENEDSDYADLIFRACGSDGKDLDEGVSYGNAQGYWWKPCHGCPGAVWVEPIRDLVGPIMDGFNGFPH